MKDLCGTRVRPNNEGYYIIQMSYWAPKDLSDVMRARWSNLSYTTRVWDDFQAVSEFGQGVLHPMLVKDLYTLLFEILMAQATKQIALVSHGHHYQMALLDRVHDVGHLVTLMGNRASHLEVKITKLKSEADPDQLTVARQQMAELQADNTKLKLELEELARRLEQTNKELNELREDLEESQRLINEQKANHCKADDELLSLMKENETLKAELPSKSIADYK
ncbi:hypothetical protein BHE74_00046043 [Ensete ventricosum]|nr:hypothetical protein BHE74_00046043 [Ensete ventricosum]